MWHTLTHHPAHEKDASGAEGASGTSGPTGEPASDDKAKKEKSASD